MARQANSASSWELQSYLGKAGAVLYALGYDHIPTDHNPVWLALAGLNPVDAAIIQEAVDAGEMTPEEAASFQAAAEAGRELAKRLPLWKNKSGNKGAILKAYVLCQTACLNALSGPIGNGDLGTIRQRWYFSKSAKAMGFKFASQLLEHELIKTADIVLVDDERAYNRAQRQGADRIRYKSQWTKADDKALEKELGRLARKHVWPKSGWGRAYAQGQSALLANLVREGLTYDNLWVRDASRDIDVNSPLLPDFHGVLVLEKQGLFEHFQGFCRAAGIRVLVAMSGNNAFSSVEAILNDNLRDWEGSYRPSPENPLRLFVISDHDYYGHVPVQEGAAEQFRRYLPGAVEVIRVGISPEQLRREGRSPVQAGYEFEYDYNSATREWAEDEGIWIGGSCYAIEVEALSPDQFIPDLIDAIVEAVGGDEELRKKLAERAEPDWYEVQSRIEANAYELSELLRRLAALIGWGENCQREGEHEIDQWVGATIGWDGNEDAWRKREDVLAAVAEKVAEQEEAIDLDNFVSHVQEGNAYSAWQPVGKEQATAAVIELFEEEFEDEIKETAESVDEDEESLLLALEEVFETLQEHGLSL